MAKYSTSQCAKSTAAAAKRPCLTIRQAQFAAEYLKDFNATQAAIRAGYSAKTAGQIGYRLLKHVQVRDAIAPKRDQAAADCRENVSQMKLLAERTRLEIARIAYFDPRKLFDQAGRPLSITELDDDTAAVVAGLDVLEERDAEGNVIGHVKKWKIADKNAALEKAAKIDGLYERDNDQSKPRTLVVVVPAKEASESAVHPRAGAGQAL